jgi:cytochrome P450
LRDVITPYIRKQLSDPDTAGGPKTVNSLAIQAYLAETVKSKEADDAFVENALAHLKIFLLAGHDTTGTTLCWVYYRLHRNPRVAQKVRAELNSVFGTKVSLTADQIREDPSLLNRLTYTSAVLKETLRMYPPVASVRGGSPDFFLIHPETHQKYPTDGFMMLSSSHSVHRNEDYWPQPDEFIPERWISENGDPVNPVSNKSAYRPFELGPRNCIGQELALTELRLILALTVREFNILPQYSKKDDKIFGEPIYQADLPGEITAHITGGMPVKVQLTAAFA